MPEEAVPRSFVERDRENFGWLPIGVAEIRAGLDTNCVKYKCKEQTCYFRDIKCIRAVKRLRVFCTVKDSGKMEAFVVQTRWRPGLRRAKPSQFSDYGRCDDELKKVWLGLTVLILKRYDRVFGNDLLSRNLTND